MLCISSENISEPKTDTLRWSAITLLKDTFRSSNIDILRPKGISFPTIYNTKLPPFDTKLIHSHRLFGEILFNMKKMSIVRQSCVREVVWRGSIKINKTGRSIFQNLTESAKFTKPTPVFTPSTFSKKKWW